MLWKELVKIALLGTEHSSFNELTISKLTDFGIETSKEPSYQLAEAAAMVSQFRKAGFHLQDFQGKLPSPSQSTTGKQTTAKTSQHLRMILAGPQMPVLPEFLYLMKKNGRLLPTAELPALMWLPDIETYWKAIAPLIGEDGHWLLNQNPAWANRLKSAQSFDWQTGSRTERFSQFRFWREQSPKFALELLASTWETESPADKANFIGFMDTGLSLEDEAFLEKCLDDRRKEVRQAAAQLLPKITESKLAKRMVARAKSCVIFSNNKLKINVLESLDLAALRDGLLHIHLGWPGGAQAGILGQMIALVSPEIWEKQSTPDEVLQLFLKSDWNETLLRAVVEATVLHQNHKWAFALLDFWQKNDSLQFWEMPICNQLAKLVSPPEVNQLATRFLKEKAMLPTEGTSVFRLLKFSEANWSHELSLLIVSLFRKEIVQDYRQFWQLQHLKEYLQMLGLRSDPNLFEQIQTGWSNDSVQWRMWEKPVEDMLTRLLFRREMRQNIQAAD